jgi:REP element-mobilizing transposase RayT
VHVTLRVRPDVPSLRGGAFVREFRRSLAEAKERGDFRVAHYALQHDRLHLIVEAQGMQALANGMKSIGARLARAMNRTCGRSGPVLDGRYHHHLLRTPQEVRQTLAYVLLAGRREASRARPLDPASSARWFDGFRPEVVSRFPAARGDPEVAPAHTWLLKTGWRRHGLVDHGEEPKLEKDSLPPS